ncbi:MAG: hypothetical protein R2684_02010 [Pyrinomonadaceae bacterium]
MFKVLITIVLAMVMLPISVMADEVLVSAGTEVQVVAMNNVDTANARIGADANFRLADSSANSVLPVGSELLGRVVEVKNAATGNGVARMVILFDFLKVGDNFYPVSAVIVSAGEALPGVKMTPSQNFPNATLLERKTGDFRIDEGTTFTLRIIGDVITP